MGQLLRLAEHTLEHEAQPLGNGPACFVAGVAADFNPVELHFEQSIINKHSAGAGHIAVAFIAFAKPVADAD
ncbi:hypothetical protein D3C81_2231840 [compost metagenome]